MTTISKPQPGGRFNLPLVPSIIAGALVLALIVSLIIGPGMLSSSDTAAGRTTVVAGNGSVIDQVIANGTIEPRTTAELAFAGSGGRVSQVLVEPGDRVAAGDPLIALEVRRLQAAVVIAQADLNQARADRQALVDGATADEIAAAQAQVDAARGTLAQTEASVTNADLLAAQARIDEAQALLARLEAGARPAEQRSADAQLAQAEAALITQRDALSSAKTTAELALQRATAELTRVQATYAEARSNWEYVQQTGNDPINPTRTNTQGRSVDNQVSAGQREQYYAAFVRAEAALRDAEAALQQAVVNFDTARQAEVSGIRDAEARVAAALANADNIRAGADADAIAAARARLASAIAELDRLRGAARTAAIATQRANLDNAEARLAQLTNDPTASALARAEATVARATAQLELAQADLDDAVLRAPFAGIIGNIQIEVGEVIGNQSPITLLDTSRYSVKLKVDEIDVVRVQVGQAVDVTIDALNGPPLNGTVRRITPLASDSGSVTSYEVTVEVDPANQPVRPGMTTSAAILIARADNVLTIPAAAISMVAGMPTVEVLISGADGRRTIERRTIEPGLQAGSLVEVRSGIRAGDEIVLP
ncbi:MAG TPA: efflux RND transporter periplasmic adaptor subunit [Roseiflexaceae bacterium]|nr:efflux RND transporter periplasmic adaptor subunit [Roseiflexaceae bacterium]HMP39735.1 efflux RND transporter periplasmic adaptor subunit [Roseiflexaceae bacterium]